MIFSEKEKKRFWDKVDIKDENDCWNWNASKTGGYGRLMVKNNLLLATRISWILKNGEIEDGMCVCHKCDNPACVNPSHLFLGTHTDNMRDCWRKGRNSHIGEKNTNAKLTIKDVLEIRELRNNNPSLSYNNIGKIFGVTETMVGYIVRKNNWSFI
jgi:hypothetical protein